MVYAKIKGPVQRNVLDLLVEQGDALMSTVVNGSRAHLNAHFLRNPAKSLRPSKAFQLRGMRLASGISATRRYIFFSSLSFFLFRSPLSLTPLSARHLPLSSLRQPAVKAASSPSLSSFDLLPPRTEDARALNRWESFGSISGAATVLPRKENWYLAQPPHVHLTPLLLPFLPVHDTPVPSQRPRFISRPSNCTRFVRFVVYPRLASCRIDGLWERIGVSIR